MYRLYSVYVTGQLSSCQNQLGKNEKQILPLASPAIFFKLRVRRKDGLEFRMDVWDVVSFSLSLSGISMRKLGEREKTTHMCIIRYLYCGCHVTKYTQLL